MEEKLKALGLDAEMVGKVSEIFNAELSGNYVPYHRFKEVNDAKVKFEKDVSDRDAQLEKLKNSNGDVEKLRDEIVKLQNSNQKAKEEYEANLKVMRRDDFVKTTLLGEGLLDTKYIPGVTAYLDVANLDVDSVSSVSAFKDKISEVKSIASMWFKSETIPTTEINGLQVNDPINKIQSGSDNLDKDSYEYMLRQAEGY